MAIVWVLGAVAGIGVTAVNILPAETARSLSIVTIERRMILLLAGAGLAAALALGSHTRFETAAMAERRGLDSLARGNSTEAISYLQEASICNAYEPQYQTELGGAYLNLAMTRPAPPAGDPTYLLSSPQPKTMAIAQVLSLPRSEIVQLAQVSLESAHALSPLDPDTDANLGNLYLQSGEVERAMVAFQAAERLSPQNPRYVDQEALAELQAGQLSRAMSTARTALALDDTFWYSHYTTALVQHSAGSYQDARQEAALALYWMRNYWPQPPATQVAQLRTLARTG
jgi:tetratricopeptide (TPR) repeat protein